MLSSSVKDLQEFCQAHTQKTLMVGMSLCLVEAIDTRP